MNQTTAPATFRDQVLNLFRTKTIVSTEELATILQCPNQEPKTIRRRLYNLNVSADLFAPRRWVLV